MPNEINLYLYHYHKPLEDRLKLLVNNIFIVPHFPWGVQRILKGEGLSRRGMSLQRVKQDWLREFYEVNEKTESVKAQTEMVERCRE